jgi:hypothetical protein
MRLWTVLAVVIALALPALAIADVVHPCEESQEAPSLGTAPVDAAVVADLVLDPVIRHGVVFLLLSSAAIVGTPWLLAGAAVALVSLPRRIRARLP